MKLSQVFPSRRSVVLYVRVPTKNHGRDSEAGNMELVCDKGIFLSRD
jgi:hypothetical protein